MGPRRPILQEGVAEIALESRMYGFLAVPHLSYLRSSVAVTNISPHSTKLSPAYSRISEVSVVCGGNA